MRIPRIHLPQALHPGLEIELPAQAGEHLVRVLRLAPGDRVQLFDGSGAEFAAELQSLGRRGVRVRIGAALTPVERESPLRITLAQGIARGDKMDWILQKATELGVDAIVPLLTERTQVRLDARREASRIEHWRAVLISACEQCGRSHLPRLAAPLRLADWATASDAIPGPRLALDPDGPRRLRELQLAGSCTLVVGPEGGLSTQDLATLAAAGFIGLRLGPRILRTETAGLAALAALQALAGDF